MSLLRFELKKEHLLLLKHLKWSLYKDKFLLSAWDVEDDSPFGGDNKYEDMELILSGMPDLFDPLNTFERKEYSDDEKAEYDMLLAELPKALEIMLLTNSFDVGKYKARYHDRLWKKI